MAVFVPPLKIHGIKTKLVDRIAKVVDSIGRDDRTWVEPFMGSGSVGFNMGFSHSVFGDVNPHVVEFYSLLNHGIDGAVVSDYLTSEGEILRSNGAEYYYEVRKRFNEESSGVHRSLDFLFLDHAGYNGIMRFNKSHGYNVPFSGDPDRFNEGKVKLVSGRVDELCQMMQGKDWEFFCRPCSETLEATSGQDRIIYCDPPYVGRNMGYYGGWGIPDEMAMCQALNDSGQPYIVSTWLSDKDGVNCCIDDIWRPRASIILELDHEYHVGAGCNHRSCAVKEVLIVGNVPPERADEIRASCATQA